MKTGLLAAAISLVASGTLAQHSHVPSADVETGQAQFAAIAEIVTTLRDDPQTDWSRVDINALRDHLVDMDNVTTKASVARHIEGSRVTFTITGDTQVAASIQRMVLAHSPMLQGASGWTVRAQKREGGATMSVQADTDSGLREVLGLGFFGLMTIGAHHQQHHVMIATGRSPH